MKKPVLFALMGVFCLQVSAQNEVDALRYSDLNYEGTARFMGMGGAFGSVGGDLSAIGINPASMARFSKNEFSLTPELAMFKANASLYGTETTDQNTNFNFTNLGFVGTHNFKSKEITGWKSVQFGVTYNRLNNYNEHFTVSGNAYNSLAVVFADWAEGIPAGELETAAPYDSYLAYEAYLIDPDPANQDNYVSAVYNGNAVTKTVERKGRMSQLDFAMSGNYMNKFYVGGSIGLPSIRFTENSTHYEVPSDTLIMEVEDFTYSQFLRTTGTGFNFKLGVIALPTDWIRLGASIQTPSFFRMNDRWQNSIESNFDNGDRYELNSVEGTYVYKLRTPTRFTGSASFVLMKRMVLSADYELMNYGKSKLGSDPYGVSDYSFDAENTAISEAYKSASTLRLGAEVRLTKSFLARAGYQLKENPIIDNNTNQQIYSAGAGYRKNKFYVDVAYAMSRTSDNYYLIDPTLIQAAKLNKNWSKYVVTVGFRY